MLNPFCSRPLSTHEYSTLLIFFQSPFGSHPLDSFGTILDMLITSFKWIFPLLLAIPISLSSALALADADLTARQADVYVPSYFLHLLRR